MKKCLVLLAVLFLAFNAGSAIRCYVCSGKSCLDPYPGNPEHEVACPSTATHCLKMDRDKGESITRQCRTVYLAPVQDRQDKGSYHDIVAAYCNSTDLCNGSGRLGEVSMMMILLPAFLVLRISFFSRL